MIPPPGDRTPRPSSVTPKGDAWGSAAAPAHRGAPPDHGSAVRGAWSLTRSAAGRSALGGRQLVVARGVEGVVDRDDLVAVPLHPAVPLEGERLARGLYNIFEIMGKDIAAQNTVYTNSPQLIPDTEIWELLEKNHLHFNRKADIVR